MEQTSPSKVVYEAEIPNKATQNTTETSVDQRNRYCKIIQNRKFWLILSVFILLILAIITPIILFFQKDTIRNPSSIISTTITSHTANKIQESLHINHITNNTKWKQNGTTVVMIDGFSINGIYVDDNQSIYMAHSGLNCVLKCEYNAMSTQIVAGANREGNRTDQLSHPLDVIVDKTNDSMIICDRGNKRVMRWPRQNARNGDIIISEIACHGLAMDNEGFLYVASLQKDEVRRWKIGDTFGTIVAGGNGRGKHLRQLDTPTYIFVDDEHSLYVSDSMNDRVVKWMKGEKEGVMVAGGQEYKLNRLFSPSGIAVDRLGNVYAVDKYNHRVIRWIKGATEDSTVVGGNGFGFKPNQLTTPEDMSFDRYGNLYVADSDNKRIQKFLIDSY